MDLIKDFFKKPLSDKNVAWMIRLFCVVFVVISYVIATTKTPIFDMMSYSWGIISGSFLAPYLLSLYWKKLNRTGAWAGILSGFTVALIPAVSKIIQMCAGENTPALAATLLTKGAEFAVLAMLVSIVFCFVFSAAFKNVDEKQKQSSEKFYKGTI